MARSSNNEPYDEDISLNEDYDLSEFNDIIISADDSLESILEKFSTIRANKPAEPLTEEEFESEEPELQNAELEAVPEESAVTAKKEAPKPVKKPLKKSKTHSIELWNRIKDTIGYSLADVWNLVRYEFIADPESFFRKLGFTLLEFFNKFMYWAARVSRYFLLPLSAGLVIAGVLLFSTHTMAIKVTMADRVIGYVKNTNDYDMAVSRAEQVLSEQLGEDCQVDIVPQYEISVVRKELVLDEASLEKNVTEVSSESVGKNYGLFVDGTLIGTYTKEKSIEEMLENIKAPYQTGAANESAVFVQNVEIIEGTYADSAAMTIAEMRSRLLSSSVIEQYEWQSEDTLDGVLKKYNMSREIFTMVNPNIDLVFNEGDTVNVVVIKPLVSVQVQRTIVYDEPIPFETETTYDPNVWQNKKTIVTKGVDGMTEITATVLLIDGVEMGREVISEIVTREPITEIVIEGTKEIASSGKYIWPLEEGTFFTITDRYLEWREDHNHGALDIAGWTGTPILACDAGKVIEAGWDGSYGYQVLLLHDDGVYTRYAHCSALLVKAGDMVYQGQEIGLMGSTGYSTGPHLHLEFLVDGERTDPELFIKVPGE